MSGPRTSCRPGTITTSSTSILPPVKWKYLSTRDVRSLPSGSVTPYSNRATTASPSATNSRDPISASPTAAYTAVDNAFRPAMSTPSKGKVDVTRHEDVIDHADITTGHHILDEPANDGLVLLGTHMLHLSRSAPQDRHRRPWVGDRKSAGPAPREEFTAAKGTHPRPTQRPESDRPLGHQRGSGSDERVVAQALASRGSPGARNRSSGAALADARLWAKALVRCAQRRPSPRRHCKSWAVRQGRERIRSSAQAPLPRCGNQASRPRATASEQSRTLATCDRGLPAQVTQAATAKS